VILSLVPTIGGLQPKSKSNEPHPAALLVEAQILHMILDLILGKITLITLNKNNEKGSASSKRKDDDDDKREPTTTSITLQVSGAAVSKALQVVLGLSSSSQKMRQLYRRFGDLGDVAAEVLSENSKTSVKSFFVPKKPVSTNGKGGNNKVKLSVQYVHESLQALATVPSGTGSQTTRHNLLLQLFRAVSDSDAASLDGETVTKDSKSKQDMMRFLVRTVLGNMRLGATLKTVLTALAMAVSDLRSGSEHSRSNGETSGGISSTKSDMAERLQKVYNVCPRLNEICLALLQGGVEYAEESCSLACGFPIEPMLANPASSIQRVEDFIRKTGNGSSSIAEWKYDGVRCQAHCYQSIKGDKPTVRLFSRHLLDQTEQYPDIAEAFLESANLSAQQKGRNAPESFICDAEIVAVTEDGTAENGAIPTYRLLPFQDLRRGTSAANGKRSGGQVRLYCFDILYLNGDSLLKVPLWRRQELMREYFVETASFAFAKSTSLPALTLTSTVQFDQTLLTSVLREAVDGGAEGLMVKLTGKYEGASDECTAASTKSSGLGYYESGTRSHEWLKVKRDYIGDSEFSDTIDVVPIGAWYGNGRKAQAGFLSPVLLAVYDEDDGVFCSISRCMSFSDEMYSGMKGFYFEGKPYGETSSARKKSDVASIDENFSVIDGGSVPESGGEEESGSDEGNELNHVETKSRDGNDMEKSDRVNCFASRPPSSVISTNENPPIWFQPLEVFEVSFADLSISRTHTAAAGLIDDPQGEGRGVALRFPRFKRKRPDKSPTQATTTVQVAQLFYQQSKIAE